MKILICLCLFLNLAYAGGGPEAVALIVNINDPDSREIANFYAKLRNIPDSNIIYLSNVPKQNTISLAEFRTNILTPIFAAIQKRKIGTKIDYITYSCGFPTRVTFDKQYAKKFHWVANPQASLTGLTYLYKFSANDEKAFLDPNSNNYFRQSRPDIKVDPTIKKATAEDTHSIDQFFAQKRIRDNKRRKEKKQKSQEDIDWEIAGWEQARKDLLAVAKKFPRDPSLHYNLACTQAMCGKLDDAIASLHISIDNGWTNWSHMQGDTDLKQLRERDDFKSLIKKLKEIPLVSLPSMGFSALFGFTKQGQVVKPNLGMNYVISTMLGYTGERGNTVDEIKSYLQKAADADGTHPKGSIYFPLNGDIRSKTREWAVYHCAKLIQEKGIDAQIIRGTIPKNAKNVMGVHAGIATFDWPNSGSTFLPGAIGEHLTSWGAEFDRQGQTKISAWLRAGAAGSSGTISEPYALKFKFPNAFLYVHYINGCSLGESFYQSVASPYELLIIGDALCRPYATFNSISVSDFPKKELTEPVNVTVNAKDPYKIYVAYSNGSAFVSGDSNTPLRLDPKVFPPGYNELSIVCLDKSLIQTRSVLRLPLHVGTEQLLTHCEASIKDKTLSINFTCKNTDNFSKINFLHHGITVASSDQSSGTVTIKHTSIGAGPIQILPVITNAEGRTIYRGAKLDLEW